MWLQQGPIIAQELISKIEMTGWVLDKITNHGDNVLSHKGAHRKIYMITGSFSVPPSKVAAELFNNVQLIPNWNAAVTQCEILQVTNTYNCYCYCYKCCRKINKQGSIF